MIKHMVIMKIVEHQCCFRVLGILVDILEPLKLLDLMRGYRGYEGLIFHVMLGKEYIVILRSYLIGFYSIISIIIIIIISNNGT